jgi:glycosyltransferase involved in cell wall biosynthesis
MRTERLPDVVCLSHLRWNFVFQRPHHLMTRFARHRRVFYVEEYVPDAAVAHMEMTFDGGVSIAVPHVPPNATGATLIALQRRLLDALLAAHRVDSYALWYYTPMALPFSRHLRPVTVAYDCMDELSAFAAAPPELRDLESELLTRADLVTTGGHTLYEAKRGLHGNVHAFPSSVDVAHFARARTVREAADQADIPRPRLGYFGVIDERMDLGLLAGIADARPAWQLVLVGPLAKIDPGNLPQRPNIHYLGARRYEDLPEYLAGWDVALLPFARNEATRFISPTKTPEYLAAGRPVVSTSIRDVVRPYGERGLVRIADDVPDSVAAIEALLADRSETRQRAADTWLESMSWDRTWRRMSDLLAGVSAPAPSSVAA